MKLLIIFFLAIYFQSFCGNTGGGFVRGNMVSLQDSLNTITLRKNTTRDIIILLVNGRRYAVRDSMGSFFDSTSLSTRIDLTIVRLK